MATRADVMRAKQMKIAGMREEIERLTAEIQQRDEQLQEINEFAEKHHGLKDIHPTDFVAHVACMSASGKQT